MPDARDFDLLRVPDERFDVPPPRRPIGLWIAAAVLVVGTAIALYIVFGGRREPSPTTTAKTDSVKTPQAAAQPLGAEPASVDVPPLNESDPVVRELVRQLTSHPRVAAWLTTDNLIRNFVVVASRVADGKGASGQLGVLRPQTAFYVVRRNEVRYIDPESYRRYDGIADAIASMDPAGTARLYATLKPRVEEAYTELGVPNTPFDRTLERSIVMLLETPVVNDPVAVEALGGTAYKFADPRLEALTPAQKHLLRTGPRNVRTIQASLRAIALALGIPAERLPAEHAARD